MAPKKKKAVRCRRGYLKRYNKCIRDVKCHKNYKKTLSKDKRFFRCVLYRCNRGYVKVGARCIKNVSCKRGYTKKLWQNRAYRCYKKKKAYRQLRSTGSCYNISKRGVGRSKMPRRMHTYCSERGNSYCVSHCVQGCRVPA